MIGSSLRQAKLDRQKPLPRYHCVAPASMFGISNYGLGNTPPPPPPPPWSLQSGKIFPLPDYNVDTFSCFIFLIRESKGMQHFLLELMTKKWKKETKWGRERRATSLDIKAKTAYI